MAGKKILLIDDEQGFCNVVGMNLQLLGKFKVATAQNGKDGIRLAKKLRPDVILLDIIMPKMDGFEVLKVLKKSEETLFIPVIMLTAVDESEAKLKAGQMYSEYYITKPIKSEELIAKINMVLDLRQKPGTA